MRPVRRDPENLVFVFAMRYCLPTFLFFLSFIAHAQQVDSTWQPSGQVREIALSSRFKGVFNAQYKTRLSRWIFDFTASVNGPARVYDFMRTLTDEGGDLMYPEG